MNEHETWKVGDTLASNKTAARWGYLVVPRTAKVVAAHGKRDITIRLHGRDERGTRLGLAREGWRLITDRDREIIAHENALNECLDALEAATTKARGEKSVPRLVALAAFLREWPEIPEAAR
jgi:hypothetical protein